MDFKFIIYNPVTKLFDFFIDSLIIEFNKININTILINKSIFIHENNDIKFDIKFDINFNKDIILLIFNPHFFFDDKNIKEQVNSIVKNFRYKILYITEPINFIVEKKIYEDLIKLIKPYALWTYTNENFQKLNTYVNIFKIFPNFNDAYNLTDLSLENIKNKNIDKIIFFGNININRESICNSFSDYLINYTNSWEKESWSSILDKNLFYLNIHRRVNCKSFESFRIIPLLANGAIIFSERCNENEENIYSKYNIIFVDKSKLYETFIKYIENIDYDSIYEKALLFRNNLIKNDLEDYIKFHKKTL